MKRILSLALLAPLSACLGTPRFHDASIRIDDRAHARVARAELLRTEEGWALEGTLHGVTFEAPPSRTVLVEAFDGEGAVIASKLVVAYLTEAPDAKRGQDRARFIVEVPAPELTSQYSIRVVD